MNALLCQFVLILFCVCVDVFVYLAFVDVMLSFFIIYLIVDVGLSILMQVWVYVLEDLDGIH